ncbi:Hypothetical protein FKW44_009699, partial [Caligus rogercresseyi]
MNGETILMLSCLVFFILYALTYFAYLLTLICREKKRRSNPTTTRRTFQVRALVAAVRATAVTKAVRKAVRNMSLRTPLKDEKSRPPSISTKCDSKTPHIPSSMNVPDVEDPKDSYKQN